MTECTIKHLQTENRHLRDLLVSLSATLLRNAAIETDVAGRAADSAEAGRLFREAEECFRCARLPDLKKEIAHGLETAGNELLALSVSIETEIQRSRRKK